MGTSAMIVVDAPAPLRVFDDVRADLLPSLERAIRLQALEHRETYPSLNRGGWKSNDRLFETTPGIFAWIDPAIDGLCQTLSREFLDGGHPRGWAMINGRGSHHPRHTHYSTKVSGIYYITAGSEPTTPTIFEIPNVALDQVAEVAIAPAPGRLVLFPGSLWHRVPVVEGDLPRITIAFDVAR